MGILLLSKVSPKDLLQPVGEGGGLEGRARTHSFEKDKSHPFSSSQLQVV